MNLDLFKKEQLEKVNEKPEASTQEVFIYTEDQLMARLRFFIGICLALTLTGIVFVVLYSIIFVTQPLNAISPIDQKFFELIIPIATFLTGTLSGIMLAGKDKDAAMKAMDMASGVNKPTPPSAPRPPLPTPGGSPAPVVPPSVPSVSVPPVAVPQVDVPAAEVPRVPVVPIVRPPQ
jgi:hypothetical protein